MNFRCGYSLAALILFAIEVAMARLKELAYPTRPTPSSDSPPSTGTIAPVT